MYQFNIVILQYNNLRFDIRSSNLTHQIFNFKSKKMGVTKTHHFTEEQNEIANLLKALAHPARVAIVEYLLSVDTCICNDIVAEINLAQPTVSQHLKELKNAGIIQGEVEAKSICYCINPKTLRKLEHFITEIRRKLENNGINCC